MLYNIHKLNCKLLVSRDGRATMSASFWCPQSHSNSKPPHFQAIWYLCAYCGSKLDWRIPDVAWQMTNMVVARWNITVNVRYRSPKISLTFMHIDCICLENDRLAERSRPRYFKHSTLSKSEPPRVSFRQGWVPLSRNNHIQWVDPHLSNLLLCEHPDWLNSLLQSLCNEKLHHSLVQ